MDRLRYFSLSLGEDEFLCQGEKRQPQSMVSSDAIIFSAGDGLVFGEG